MKPMPIAIRIFEPIALAFKAGAMPQQLHGTVQALSCILCEGLASPPSRMGWLQAPERQAIFVCCGSCSDCSDQELEAKIVDKISDSPPETSPAEAPALAAIEASPASAWATRAAKDWVKPGAAQHARAT
jgi:hypothetical protein